MGVTKVLLAEPRGFCAGVEKAIKALAWMVRVFEPPIYCYHEIVHNKVVVDRFRKLGVVFVDSIDDVPPGAPVMLSAHGTAPSVVAESQGSGRVSINAVCPLVTKVHHEVKVRSQRGFEILYVGHRGHDEAVGTIAVAPESVHLIEDEHALDDLGRLKGQVALVAQTTLSMDEWAEVRERVEHDYPEIWMPNKSDLCFATTNRQGALKEIAQHSDVVVILGSSNSSNTVALEKVARSCGVSEVYRVNSAAELPENLTGIVGVTAGASAPDELVEEVLALLDPLEGIEVVHHIDEKEYFPPPPELRDFLRQLAALVKVATLSPLPYANITSDDAAISASKTLADLDQGLSTV
jgi:4-hydroxy-3-methylbut-2-enyl diphosphate reductase